jgi:urate oxidase
VKLGWNRYGKTGVRLVKVRRRQGPHELVELTIDVQLEGAFERVYTDGDNSQCLPTDTMKNTVYALARQDEIRHAEAFAERLADHFAKQPGVTRSTVSIAEHPWSRISVAGQPHPHAFMQPGGEQWTAVAVCDHTGTHITAGLTNLVVLKTTDSSFSGFPHDAYTTLADTGDRILATSITASWRYRRGTTEFGARDRIREALLETFAAHVSQSVQHTLNAMAGTALDVCADIIDVTLTLPNRHHLLVDLKPFALDNPGEVFVATDRPSGMIEATVSRG